MPNDRELATLLLANSMLMTILLAMSTCLNGLQRTNRSRSRFTLTDFEIKYVAERQIIRSGISTRTSSYNDQ
jgi:hypothetical protein